MSEENGNRMHAETEDASRHDDASRVRAERSKAQAGTGKGPGSAGRFTPMRVVRLVIQIVFFALSPQVFSMAFAGARSLLASAGKFEAIAPTSFVILLVGTCVFTVLFGRFFCGFACAFGTLSDVLYELGFAVCRALGIKRRRFGDAVQGKLRYAKYVVLVALLAFSFAGGSSVIGAASPWTAFGRITNLQFAAMGVVGLVLLVLIVVGMVWQERFFCEYLCPLGAIFSLLPILSFSNHRRDMDACIGCARCKKRCPVGVYPPGESAQMGECISCGACEVVCPAACVFQGSPRTAAKGALRLDAAETNPGAETIPQPGPGRLASPAAETSQRQRPRLPEPRRAVRAVVLAVVLLAFFWLVGAVKFIPTLGLL